MRYCLNEYGPFSGNEVSPEKAKKVQRYVDTVISESGMSFWSAAAVEAVDLNQEIDDSHFYVVSKGESCDGVRWMTLDVDRTGWGSRTSSTTYSIMLWGQGDEVHFREAVKKVMFFLSYSVHWESALFNGTRCEVFASLSDSDKASVVRMISAGSPLLKLKDGLVLERVDYEFSLPLFRWIVDNAYGELFAADVDGEEFLHQKLVHSVGNILRVVTP